MTLQPEERPDGVVLIGKLPLDGAAGYDQYQIVQRSGSPQYGELSVPAGDSRADARVCFGFRRCCEYDEGDKPGQDYVVVRVGGGYVVGIVADGVSRSFYGNLAAEYVSNWMVEELWRQRADTPEAESLEGLLKQAEARFADYMDKYPIPTDLPPYLIQALERKRPKGSQTVFAAFVLNVAEARLALYQVGDIQALVHNSRPEPEVVESPAKGRWSSAGKSPMLLEKKVFTNVNGLVVKSDGVSEEWGRTLDANELAADRFGLMAKARAQNDDISFIALQLDAACTVAAAATTQPAAVDARSEERPTGVETVRPEQPAPPSQKVTPQRPKKQERKAKKQVPPAGSAAPPANPPPAATELTRGVGNKIAQDGDAQGPHDRQDGSTSEGPGRKRAATPEARDPYWGMKMLAIGVIVGLAAGVAITLLAVTAVRRLTNGPAGGKQAAQSPPVAQTTPDGQNPPASEHGSVSVEAKEVEQISFQNTHRRLFPNLIKANPTTLVGEIIAYISAEGVDVDGVELVLNNGEQAKVERASVEGERPSFFVRLQGVAGPSPVKIRVFGQDGKVLYEGQQEMRGREAKSPANKSPFLGYYEISIKRGG